MTKAERKAADKAAKKAKADAMAETAAAIAATPTPAEASAVAQVKTDNQPEPEVKAEGENVSPIIPSETAPPVVEPKPATNNNAGNLLARIAEWGLRASDVMQEFHKLAFEVLETVKDTRNATPALHLQNAMPKGMRKRAFAVWLRTYSPINLTKEDEKTGNFTECNLLKPGDKFFRDFDIEEAKKNPFGDEKEEVKALDPSKMDIAKTLLNNMISVARSILKEPKAGSSKPVRTLAIPVENAQRNLGRMRGQHAALNKAGMTGPLDDSTQDLIKRALQVGREDKLQQKVEAKAEAKAA